MTTYDEGPTPSFGSLMNQLIRAFATAPAEPFGTVIDVVPKSTAAIDQTTEAMS